MFGGYDDSNPTVNIINKADAIILEYPDNHVLNTISKLLATTACSLDNI